MTSGSLAKEHAMRSGFMPMRRRGEHWRLVQETVETLRRTEFFPKTRREQGLENAMVTALKNNPVIADHITTQLRNDPIDKVAHAKLLGMRHRPDAAIGQDGTAIELKAVSYPRHFREALGQAIAYRVKYRFVIMCLVDRTTKMRLVEYASDPNRPGNHLFTGLARDYGIFTIIAPRREQGRKRGFNNLTFIA